jgi:hypothetical protein
MGVSGMVVRRGIAEIGALSKQVRVRRAMKKSVTYNICMLMG